MRLVSRTGIEPIPADLPRPRITPDWSGSVDLSALSRFRVLQVFRG